MLDDDRMKVSNAASCHIIVIASCPITISTSVSESDLVVSCANIPCLVLDRLIFFEISASLGMALILLDVVRCPVSKLVAELRATT